MKKFFTLAIAMIATLSVNAQEVCQIDAEGAGVVENLGSDGKDQGVTIADGTAVGQSDNLTITLIDYAEAVKATSCKMNNSGFVIGGAELTADGITGSNNPKDVSGNGPATGDGSGTVGGVPVSGFAINIETSDNVAEEGAYLYVAGKFSSHKNYYVFENGLCIGYELAMWVDADASLQPLKITVENDAEEGGVPCRTAAIDTPEAIFTGAAATIKGNGEGVMVFPVYPGCSYVVGAQGSKISVCGAVLTSSNTVSVVLPETEDTKNSKTYDAVTLIEEGSTPSGISSVAIDNAVDADAPAYNIAGQRVSKDAKGLVIVGGKKYVNK